MIEDGESKIEDRNSSMLFLAPPFSILDSRSFGGK